jgi:Beta-lactamase
MPLRLVRVVSVLLLLATSATTQARLPSDAPVKAMLQQLVDSHGITGIVVGLLDQAGTRRVFALGNPGADARPTHFSGLPLMPTNLAPANPANPFADYTVNKLYEGLSNYDLARNPGDRFEYSNIGVALLGHVLALRAGTAYEALVSDRILRPVEMSHTAVTLTPWMKDHFVRGHDRTGKPVANWDFPTLAGMGGLRSTMNDLLAACHQHSSKDVWDSTGSAPDPVSAESRGPSA